MDAYIGGAWRSPTTAEAYINGAWRSLQYGEAYISGAWRTIANFTMPPTGGGGGGGGTLSLSLSTHEIDGLGAINSTTVTSGSVTVIPSGGLAPYSYSWSIVSSDGQSYAINSPTTATTTVTGSGLPLDTTSTCAIHSVVTDSLGTSATSDNVLAELTTRSTL